MAASPTPSSRSASGLSAAPCWRRVRALEEAGFIKGYRAEIDRKKIGLGVLAFVRCRHRAGHRRKHPQARRRDSPAARGHRLPLHQRHRHLRAAGGFAGPGCVLALRAAVPCSTCRTSRTCTPASRSARSRRAMPCRSATWQRSRADRRPHATTDNRRRCHHRRRNPSRSARRRAARVGRAGAAEAAGVPDVVVHLAGRPTSACG